MAECPCPRPTAQARLCPETNALTRRADDPHTPRPGTRWKGVCAQTTHLSPGDQCLAELPLVLTQLIPSPSSTGRCPPLAPTTCPARGKWHRGTRSPKLAAWATHCHLSNRKQGSQVRRPETERASQEETCECSQGCGGGCGASGNCARAGGQQDTQDLGRSGR